MPVPLSILDLAPIGRGETARESFATSVALASWLRGLAAAHVDEMLTYMAAGTPADVRAYLDAFAYLTHADELITVHPARTADKRQLNSVLLLGHGSVG
jgi:hypothetical protein